MITFQTFLLGLMITSTLTGLTTEAIKKIIAERSKNYYANTLAGVVSLIISAAVSAGYITLNNVEFTNQMIVYGIALMFLSWLCAMVGYDKVIQAISQFKTYGEDDK